MGSDFNSRLPRAAVIGALLAVLGISLFLALWVVLGSAGFEAFPRLILSLCIPPAVIALILGVYVLVARPNR